MRDRIRAKIRAGPGVSERASEPRRLHPATLIVRWLKIVPQMLAGGIGLAAAGRGRRASGASSGSRCHRSPRSARVFALLSWWRFTYRIGAGEIVIEKGAAPAPAPGDPVRPGPGHRHRAAACSPACSAPPRCKIETGGAAKDEGDLDMIALADAQALRDHVRRGPARRGARRRRRPAARSRCCSRWTCARLLLSGLFGFSLVFLAAIAAVVQQLDQFGLVEWDDWFTDERARSGGGLWRPLQAALALAALVLAARHGRRRGADGGARFRLPADPGRGRPPAQARACSPCPRW